MDEKQLALAKEQVEKVKSMAIEAIKKVAVDEQGRLTGTFVVFGLSDGQPAPPITLGFDRDMFSILAADFENFLSIREKEEKINQIQDEKLRARLLHNLQASLK